MPKNLLRRPLRRFNLLRPSLFNLHSLIRSRLKLRHNPNVTLRLNAIIQIIITISILRILLSLLLSGAFE